MVTSYEFEKTGPYAASVDSFGPDSKPRMSFPMKVSMTVFMSVSASVFACVCFWVCYCVYVCVCAPSMSMFVTNANRSRVLFVFIPLLVLFVAILPDRSSFHVLFYFRSSPRQVLLEKSTHAKK